MTMMARVIATELAPSKFNASIVKEQGKLPTKLGLNQIKDR
jgi:hypothetical protein